MALSKLSRASREEASERAGNEVSPRYKIQALGDIAHPISLPPYPCVLWISLPLKRPLHPLLPWHLSVRPTLRTPKHPSPQLIALLLYSQWHPPHPMENPEAHSTLATITIRPLCREPTPTITTTEAISLAKRARPVRFVSTF